MGMALFNRLIPLLCTAIWLSISAPATAQSGTAADERDGWYLEISSILANPDDGDGFVWDGSFSTFGIGVGYAITPKISIEGRYRFSNSAQVALGTVPLDIDGVEVPLEVSTDFSYSLIEVGAVYTTPLSNSINFHLRGGFQSYSGELDILRFYHRASNTTVTAEFNAEGPLDDDLLWVLGGGISYRLGGQWWIRHEILLEAENDFTSVGISFAKFF